MRGAQQVHSSVSGFSRKPHSGFLAVIHGKKIKTIRRFKNDFKLSAIVYLPQQ
jgi:hypothetical protein